MIIKDFAIERFFAEYEFTAKFLLSSSDCDGYSLSEILGMASREERAAWDGLTLGYTETRGAPALRAAIGKQYQTIGQDEVLVLSPGEANFCLMNVLLKKGDHVVCMAPIYQSLYEPARSIGCSVSFWQPEPGAGWYYDPARLRSLIIKKTKLIIVNFPHNPTGYIPSFADWNEIVGIAKEKNLTLFSDEMYRSLIHDPKDEIPAACDLYDKAVSLWGMSKSFGLAGLRIGWLASKNTALLGKVESFKDYLTICNSATSEILAIIGLNHSGLLLDHNIRKIKANIEAFRLFQERNSDLMGFYRPKAGSTAFVELKTPLPAMQYARRLVENSGIMLLPSEVFDYGTSHARIGFGRASLPETLAVLEQFHKGHTSSD